MGIPYYFYTIYKKYNIHNNLFINLCDLPKAKGHRMLLFDYNSLIHPCAKHIMDAWDGVGDIETDIIQYTIKYTESIINHVKPTFIGIYIDGIAPYGKIKQQRERRFKSSFTSFSPIFDKNQISPGTTFMKRLEEALRTWKKNYDIPVDLSLSDIVGEGEHKITQFLRESSNENRNAEIYIYGLDADLLMLSLLVHLHNNYNNMYLFRDNAAPLLPVIVDIRHLGELLYKEMTGRDSGRRSKRDCCTDYIILCCLFGNDFLPPMKECSLQQYGIEPILNGYHRMKGAHLGSVIDGRFKLNINNTSQCMYYIFNAIQKTKPPFIVKEILETEIANLQVPFNKQVLLTELDPDIFTKHTLTDTEKYIYYTYYDIPYTQREIATLCIDYLSTIEWVMEYYLGIGCSNYHYPFHVAPLFIDFVNFTNTWKTFIHTEQKVDPLYYEICEKKQLDIILPQENDSTLILDTTFSRYFWQTKLLN